MREEAGGREERGTEEGDGGRDSAGRLARRKVGCVTQWCGMARGGYRTGGKGADRRPPKVRALVERPWSSGRGGAPRPQLEAAAPADQSQPLSRAPRPAATGGGSRRGARGPVVFGRAPPNKHAAAAAVGINAPADVTKYDCVCQVPAAGCRPGHGRGRRRRPRRGPAARTRRRPPRTTSAAACGGVPGRRHPPARGRPPSPPPPAASLPRPPAPLPPPLRPPVVFHRR